MADLDKLGPGKTDWAAVDALTEEDIARAVADDPDAAPIDLDGSKAVVFYPNGKPPATIRIDRDVVAFFASLRGDYRKRINAVLRDFMEREQAKVRRKRKTSMSQPAKQSGGKGKRA